MTSPQIRVVVYPAFRQRLTFSDLLLLMQVIVDETSFEAGRALVTRSEYYSTFLENALLSCATRMSTSGGVRALGSQYAARAKSEIAQELEYSNIATLQGFLLLSDFEATRGRDRLGYMYCGKYS